MKWLQITALTLGVVLLSQCGSRSTLVRKYYTLETDALVDVDLLDVPQPFLINAGFTPVKISEPYEDARIALRSQSNELVYYFYHYWADKPEAMATDLIFFTFVQSGIFRTCSRTISDTTDILIKTEITSLERIRTKKSEYAHVAGCFHMVYRPGNTEMLSYAFDRRYELKKAKNMNAFAQAIGKIIFNEAEEFVFRVADYYQYPPE